MQRFILLFLIVFSVAPKYGIAQTATDIEWVQIEARPNYASAVNRIKEIAQTLPDVNGFALDGGWYAIALGPYSAQDAQDVLQSYRRDGLIPSDSYIAQSANYSQQFWPEGVDTLSLGDLATLSARAVPPATTLEEVAPVLPGETEATPVVTAAETVEDTETRADARRSEGRLSEQERRDLQIALRWAGYYNSTIDGAFGRGTRNSMANWQSDNGFESTGILTTVQRAVLLGQYNAVLEGLGMQIVLDFEAGIEIDMPTSLVKFDRYDPPFAHYESIGDATARVILISQSGDGGTLKALYDIMQSLTIVPMEGPRSLSASRFNIVGQNADFISETQVALVEGDIKGFTLIWPVGDEVRRARVLDEMNNSIVRRTGALDPATGVNAGQSVDLFSGLEIRKPLRSRSGFFVDASGAVVTTAGAVQSCTRITLDDFYDVELTDVDTETGIAVLTPAEKLAPPEIARFSPAPPQLQSEIAVAGYSFEGQLQAPSVTFGTLADLKGLKGETELNRLSLAARPGDEGGPVIDSQGNVMGMLMPLPSGTRQLPDEVHFALTGKTIAAMLERTGFRASTGDDASALDPVGIADRGIGMTVLVSCWE